MSKRRAACCCGQLRLECEGEPFRVSVCHCRECQRRTGSAFGYQARFPREQVTHIEGDRTAYRRVADSGNAVTMHFCPRCGSTVYWELESMPEVIAVAAGAFADADFPAPAFSFWEQHKHAWIDSFVDLPLNHSA